MVIIGVIVLIVLDFFGWKLIRKWFIILVIIWVIVIRIIVIIVVIILG